MRATTYENKPKSKFEGIPLNFPLLNFSLKTKITSNDTPNLFKNVQVVLSLRNTIPPMPKKKSM